MRRVLRLLLVVIVLWGAVLTARAAGPLVDDAPVYAVYQRERGLRALQVWNTQGLRIWLLGERRDDPVGDLVWSPDGERLAFAGIGGIEVWDNILNPNGLYREHQLLGGISPAWFPDGEMLALLMPEGALRSVVATYNLTDNDLQRLTPSEMTLLFSNPTVAPNGRYIAATRNGQRVVIVTPGPAATLTEWRGAGEYPAWGPEGRFLAYIGPVDPMTPLLRNSIRVYDTETETVGSVPLPEPFEDISALAWSDDGTQMIFVGRPQTGLPTLGRSSRAVFILNIETDELRRLTSDGYNPYSISISPRGEWVAFLESYNGTTRACIIHVAQERVDCPRGLVGAFDAPAWQPTPE
ncbi:MAG: hypothetical protein AAF125_12315 [Chloroflexota bacterium]